MFEIKSRDVTSKYQAESDDVKLLKQLKLSIFQVYLNFPSPVAYGFLCEGLECSMFQMKLVEEGVYLATTLRNFRLPKDCTCLLDSPHAVQCMEYAVIMLNDVNVTELLKEPHSGRRNK
ncbi:hypothetical protein MBANPS3_012377 [Mucor bainieri]